MTLCRLTSSFIWYRLDDLRRCRELADWFGRRFYFMGNPLMLPFDLFSMKSELNLDDKIEFHIGRTTLAPDETADWKFEKFMNKFRDRFEELCSEKR